MLLCGVHTLSPNCPFLSKYLVNVHWYHSRLFIVDICVHGMAIREGITTHTDFSYTCYLDNVQKKFILQNFNKMQVYMLLCGVHTLSPNCPFLSKYLVDVHLYHSHLFIVDICLHGMAIREGITTHTDFSYTCY